MLTDLPSASLPPLANLSSLSTPAISDALDYIRRICGHLPRAPLVAKFCKSKHRNAIQDVVLDSGYASAEDEPYDEDEGPEHESHFGQLRDDPIEHAFVIRWLTGLVKRAAVRSFSDDEVEAEEREELIEDAAALLAACAGGDESSSALTRVFDFSCNIERLGNEDGAHTGEQGLTTIRVELNDAPLSDDHTSVGLQSWASSIVLAGKLCADPIAFGLGPRTSFPETRRVLELGAGTGLLAITVAKLLLAVNDATDAQIVATDFHPDVLANLRRNVHTNFPSSPSHPANSPVGVHTFDWQYPSAAAPFDVRYNLILAADVIYHASHAGWIRSCVERLLAPDGEFWLIIPVRQTGRHEGVAETVEDVFSLARDVEACSMVGEATLGILSVLEVGRNEGVGRADEEGYRLFRIGWL